ncbi:Gonadotropin-releasing hormone receptor [Aphelenchoides bicaudatus]|nr:Gonadotropin-releasing hormone receptor [Aphelenchoides bicaudatus]
MFIYTTSQIIWMWYGGDFLCRVCKFFHTFSFYLNSFVVACIAIDRVFGTYNLSTLKASQRSYLRCRRMLTVTWICAFCFSLPQSFVFRVFEPPGMENFKQCTPIWTIILNEIDMQSKIRQLSTVEFQQLVEQVHQVQLWERIYNIFHLLFVFWIPALIIVASYITVLCLLNSFAPSKKDPKWKRRILEWFFGEWSVRKHSPTNSSIHVPSATPRPSMAEGMNNHQQPLLVSIRPEQSPMMYPMNKKCRGLSYGNVRDPLFCLNENGQRSMSATSLKIDFTPRRSSATQRNIGPFALQTIHRARQLAKRQAALIIIAYLCFWAPYNIIAVVLSLTNDGFFKESAYTTLPFLNSLIVVNPLINPLIYGLFDKPQK